MYSETSI